MRVAFLGILVLGLAGCLEAQPSPAMMQLQSACDAGNLQACEAVVAQEDARRAAIAEYWASRPPVQGAILPQPAYAPPQMPTRTHCTPDFLGGMRCTTY